MDVGVNGDKKAGGRTTARAAWLLAALGTFIALGFCALCGAVLLNERRDVWAATAKDAMNLALATARDIERNIEIYDLSLRSVAEQMQQPDILSLPIDLRRRVLFSHAAAGSYFGPIVVLDAAGRLIIASGPQSAEFGNYTDKDFFHAQAERSDAGLYISHPLPQPGRWQMATCLQPSRLER